MTAFEQEILLRRASPRIAQNEPVGTKHCNHTHLLDMFRISQVLSMSTVWTTYSGSMNLKYLYLQTELGYWRAVREQRWCLQKSDLDAKVKGEVKPV